ncbi:GGDEF domain-containing protein [Streptomyces spirodelae]|uniref:Sensor domain-containing diguanylate cyclase n=1 Tax=Streptomyces spirodelae TaxID=2812904 RepID=A0ABS3X4H1_9ACTN|nr:sensor domain-containing diguanylate cyclase [Streptomyces spirodelae]MBO8189966.1 sensor domain-containing diguanylate cyclase [Streptomyces spirodelae]
MGGTGEGGEDADARLSAVVGLSQAMAAAQTAAPATARPHPYDEDEPEATAALSHRDIARAAARGACEAMGGAFASISVWERARGRLRVLVNVGERAAEEAEFPSDESYPVHDFPQVAALLHERWAGGGRPQAWVEGDGPEESAGAEGEAAHSYRRVAALRRRDRGSCVIAPIVLHGRAWGELYVARAATAPPFTRDDADFAAVLAALIASGIAQNERLEEVRRLAYTDPLTGLANRRAVETRLDEAVELHRDLGTVVSLVVCDINGLKGVNDAQGHEAGDRLLERFAAVLSAGAATLPGALAGRLGGDEFCLLAVGPTADEVVRAADELCRGAAELELGEGVACGVASTGDPVGEVRSAHRIFRLADAAQYRAKALRSEKPVVAGREGGPEDPTVRLAAAAEPFPPSPDRRRFRRGPGR